MAVPSAPLHVSFHAMDLRYVSQPLMVGHYENDPIAGAEALIDHEIVAGELGRRNRLGIYAGPRGSASVVLMARSTRELHQGSCRGVVVIGLGSLGELTLDSLTEAVRVGTLRYLLQILDRTQDGGQGQAEVGLASLLIGQNSTGNIHIGDSVTALVTGVLAANAQFAEAFPTASLRVGHLQLLEVYLDTAITATRCLQELERKLNKPQQQPPSVLLSIAPELTFGKGWRHRLDAAQPTGYWPRLIIANGESSMEAATGRPQLANTLRFSFLGERARAETLTHQRQNGLVEKMVAASIANPTHNKELSRSLFQLLVPAAFKELARDLEQLVLVLDESTANVPWELLMADGQPLSLSMRMVRQLQAPRYRQRVRQATSRSAYVIGNPSSEGFYTVFPGEGPQGSTALASLNGASQEAHAVRTRLELHGYECQESIEEENGVDVINRLYQHPYRVLHIAGHGVHDRPTRQGDRRSGVVLSDGILITAAEIEAMEAVPELVFLNCCHLAAVQREAVAYNRLAASVARQLIEIGVRAVVACGWAVDDKAALVFAETFYTAMLAGQPFGEAVFAARQAAHAPQNDPKADASNTWGAYQAYGDPAYQLETTDGAGSTPCGAGGGRTPVTHVELMDRLRQLEVQVRHGASHGEEGTALLAGLTVLQEQAAALWPDNAELAMAVADVHAAFGGSQREEACRHYQEAIRLHRGGDGLPIRAIEQLANLEVRLGEQNGEEARVVAAIERLKGLLPLLATGPSEGQALLGGACKRLAALRARGLCASDGPIGKAAMQTVLDPLEASIEAYGLANPTEISHPLNRLSLEALRGLRQPADPAAIEQARALQGQLRHAPPPVEPSFWDGVAVADALLTLRLVDRRLATEDAAGAAAAREVEGAYLEAFQNVRSTPLERESVLEHLSLLGDLAQALGRNRRSPCALCATLTNRLEAIEATLRQWEAPRAAAGSTPSGPGEGEDAMETL